MSSNKKALRELAIDAYKPVEYTRDSYNDVQVLGKDGILLSVDTSTSSPVEAPMVTFSLDQVDKNIDSSTIQNVNVGGQVVFPLQCEDVASAASSIVNSARSVVESAGILTTLGGDKPLVVSLCSMSHLNLIEKHRLSIQYLILRGAQLTALPITCELPSLKYLDISNNQLSDVDHLLDTLTSNAKTIQHLNIESNSFKDNDINSKCISICPQLFSLNGQPISVIHRISSISTYNEDPPDISMLRWKWSTVNLRYHELTLLSLPNCQLSQVHLRLFINLIDIDLSGNEIANLLDTGIAYCTKVVRCNLSNNAIESLDTITCFKYLSSLLHLNLSGNPICNLPIYRSYVFTITRFLPGSEGISGLTDLDGISVTLSERLAALKAADGDAMAWHLSVHGKFKTDSLHTLNSCVLSGLSFRSVQCDILPNLRILDISACNIYKVSGLDLLHRLMHLDVSNNPLLPLDSALEQLSQTSALVSAAFFVTGEREPRDIPYRHAVLGSLLMQHPDLTVVDDIRVTADERVEFCGSDVDKELYRFQLAVHMRHKNKRKNMCLHSSVVMQHKAIQPLSLKTLKCLDGCSLTTGDFTKYQNLVEINLANNTITDMLALGLQWLGKLQSLYLHNNSISNSVAEISKFIDTTANLRVLTLRENPSYDRLAIIGTCVSLTEMRPVFEILDSEITVKERLDALVKYGNMSVSDCELLRAKAAIIYSGIPSAQALHGTLTELNFSNMGLRAINVGAFVSLKTLDLRGNSLSSTQNIHGLATLQHLLVLDLRNNGLKLLKEILNLLKTATMLKHLGLAQNRYHKEYRMRLLVKSKGEHRLESIDNHAVTPLEMCTVRIALKGRPSGAPLNQIRLVTAMQIRAQAAYESLHALDLSHCGLDQFDALVFPNLRSLTLAYNLFTVKTLVDSRISLLNRLSSLDISYNKLRNLNSVCECISGLPLLHLVLDNNPCWKGSANRQTVIATSSNLLSLNCISVATDIQHAVPFTYLVRSRGYDGSLATLTKLDISRCSLTSVAGVAILVSLVSLNISHNNISQFPNLLDFPCLRYLDVRDNQLALSPAQLAEQHFNVQCPVLSHLYLMNAFMEVDKRGFLATMLQMFTLVSQLKMVEGFLRPHHLMVKNKKKAKRRASVRIKTRGRRSTRSNTLKMRKRPQSVSSALAPLSSVFAPPGSLDSDEYSGSKTPPTPPSGSKKSSGTTTPPRKSGTTTPPRKRAGSSTTTPKKPRLKGKKRGKGSRRGSRRGSTMKGRRRPSEDTRDMTRDVLQVAANSAIEQARKLASSGDKNANSEVERRRSSETALMSFVPKEKEPEPDAESEDDDVSETSALEAAQAILALKALSFGGLASSEEEDESSEAAVEVRAFRKLEEPSGEGLLMFQMQVINVEEESDDDSFDWEGVALDVESQ